MGVFFSGGKGLKTLAENLNRVAGKGGTSAHDKRMKLAEDDIKVWCQKLQAPLAVQTLARTLMDDLLRNHLQVPAAPKPP